MISLFYFLWALAHKIVWCQSADLTSWDPPGRKFAPMWNEAAGRTGETCGRGWPWASWANSPNNRAEVAPEIGSDPKRLEKHGWTMIDMDFGFCHPWVPYGNPMYNDMFPIFHGWQKTWMGYSLIVVFCHRHRYWCYKCILTDLSCPSKNQSCAFKTRHEWYEM